MPQVAHWIASVYPIRRDYEANVLQEAKEQKSKLKNRLDRLPEILRPMRSRAATFPLSEGRSTPRRSFEILGITLPVCLILLLATLSLKSQP